MNYNILLLILVIILIFILLKFSCKETFVSGTTLITDNQQNVAGSLFVSSDSMANLIDNIKKTNKIDGSIVGINKPLTVILDPYINYYVLNNNAITRKYDPVIF